jgi:hypothetical protein
MLPAEIKYHTRYERFSKKGLKRISTEGTSKTSGQVTIQLGDCLHEPRRSAVDGHIRTRDRGQAFHEEY